MTSGKDVECVLVFDPPTSSFKLMPLNYVLRVNPSREKPGKVKEAISRNPSPVVVNPTRSTPTPSAAAFKSIASPKVTPVSSPLINSLPQSPIVKATTSNSAKPQAGISKPPRTAKSAAKSGPTSTMKKVTRTAKNASAKVAAGRRAAPVANHTTNNAPPLVNSASKAPPAVAAPRRTAAKSLPAVASPATSPTKPATSSKPAPKKKILSEEIVHAEDDEDLEMKQVDDGSDDDLLGALANELEESLEDDSNHSNASGDSNGKYENSNGHGNSYGFSNTNDSASSDEDEQFTNRVDIIDRSSSSAANGAFNSPNGSQSRSGAPMSLRGFLSNGRPEEEELSSSEEE